MLTLTEAAGGHLAGILNRRDCEENVAVRILYRDSRLSLSLDSQKAGDATFEHEGRTVLLVDSDAVKRLDGETVDVRQTKAGKKLCHGRRKSGGSA